MLFYVSVPSFLFLNNILLYGCTTVCLIDGCFDYFHVGVIMNNATVNIHAQVLVWTYVFISLGYIPRARLLGHVVVVYVIRNRQMDFQGGCAMLYFQNNE